MLMKIYASLAKLQELLSKLAPIIIEIDDTDLQLYYEGDFDLFYQETKAQQPLFTRIILTLQEYVAGLQHRVAMMYHSKN